MIRNRDLARPRHAAGRTPARRGATSASTSTTAASASSAAISPARRRRTARFRCLACCTRPSALNTDAALSRDAARSAIARAVGGQATGDLPELVVLPLSDGYHLAYRGQAIDGHRAGQRRSSTRTRGALLQQFSEFQTDGIVGKGTGTFGDDKKISVKAASGTFVADDGLRPAAITTYDMKGNLTRTMQVLNRLTNVTAADIAADTDNVWTDPGVVDAHVYAGWYYDFLFKRFGRHGLDDRDLRIAILTHPVRLADLADGEPGRRRHSITTTRSSAPPADRTAAAPCTFGEGVPRGYFGNFEVKNFAAALDVVAHELTHGVTANSARLNGFPFSEAGALNEAFSDMFGLATTFSYEPPGNAALQANYTVGKDLIVPIGATGIRSISNPGLYRRSRPLHAADRRLRSALQLDDREPRVLSGDRGRARTARRARRCRASAPPTAIRSRRRSSGRSPC